MVKSLIEVQPVVMNIRTEANSSCFVVLDVIFMLLCGPTRELIMQLASLSSQQTKQPFLNLGHNNNQQENSTLDLSINCLES